MPKIIIDDYTLITIFYSDVDSSWYITGEEKGLQNFISFVFSLGGFYEELDKISVLYKIDLQIEKPAKSERLRKAEPATNKAKIITLVGNRTVKSIFDPYFYTSSVQTLLTLHHLGLKFASYIPCLTTNNGCKNLDKTFLKDFNTQLQMNLLVKKCPDSEHRRFFLLNDNTSLIIGPSLNDINKNEAIYIDKDKHQEDIDFFTENWSKAIECV